MRILIAEDENLLAMVIADSLKEKGYATEVVHDGKCAWESINRNPPHLLITDVRMPNIDGMELLAMVRRDYPAVIVMIMTTYASVNDAVTALKAGARDYIVKPFEIEELIERVGRVAELLTLRTEKEELEKRLNKSCKENVFFGPSPATLYLMSQIKRLAPLDVDILIEGETGTGKEVIACYLHCKSKRANRPFTPVSCAALTPTLLESELFGYVKGAYTGAEKSAVGIIEMADKGTLFLDDVDDIPIQMQPKLLRVLQERIVEPVGSREKRKVDFRLISATKMDLREEIKKGKFREDLYFRLHVVTLRIPPLRERTADILPLFAFFMRKFIDDDKKIPEIHPDTARLIQSYKWQGNVRELEHVVKHALALCDGKEILPNHLPSSITNIRNEWVSSKMFGDSPINLEEVLLEAEKSLLKWAMEKANGNQAQAAELLSIPRTTFQYRLNKINKVKE